MKTIIAIFFLACFISCKSQNTIVNQDSSTIIKPEKNQDGEWDINVLDPNYEYFLKTIANPIDIYSENFLKTRNKLLVSEWNNIYFSGRKKNVVESSIQYDPNENYGIKFEYRLYQVFVFARWKYGLKLNHLGASENNL